MTASGVERLNAPAWTGQVPFVEDWYVKANLPDRDASVWVRYTLDVSQGDQAARVWAVVDRGGKVVAEHESVYTDELTLEADPFTFSTPHGNLLTDGCGGDLDAIRWELTWEPCPYAFWLLPSWAYDLPEQISKTVTPGPDLAVHGQVAVDGERIELEGEPGQQGHVWGRSHADAWAWAHDNAGEGPVFSALAARAELGRISTPTLAMVLVRREDQTIAFRNPLANRASFGSDGLSFEARRLGHRIRGEVEPPVGGWTGLTYPDPLHGEVYCQNTKRASAEIVLEERGLTGWREIERWETKATTALEVGGTEPMPGVDLLV